LHVTTELSLLSRVAYRGKEITGPRLRGLLALLATDLRTGCGTARLVDGLWPEEQPENPQKALQILVSRLRAQLGDGVIERSPTGYRLALGEDQVDAAAVLVHAASAARYARAGDHGHALEEADAGLAFWDAPPENGGGEPLSELRAERAVTYRTLVRLRALSLARVGKHAEAVGPLTDLVAEYPKDEELLVELIRAEAATAGPAAAMARYDTYRRALRDELGADPGSALRTLHQELLRDEQPSVRHGVAHEPNPLLGRDHDLDAVTALLRTARVVTVVGPGGLGKTRLAHVVSLRAPQRTVQFVGLAGVVPDGDVAGEIASALNAADSSVAGIADALGPRALLVLDNCEHVLAPTADLVAALVATSRDVTVLTTSRAPLGLSSESVYPLPELDDAAMTELFRQRARAARPGVDLPENTVAELCRRLDGLPLAAELAAARVRVLSVPEINRRLADRFALLRGGRRDAPERHHTLHAVVDWSWHLLDADGQAALRTLSVFPGGFTAEAADRVLGADAFDVLEHLVDQSLLKVADAATGARFRMLETVREFGAAKLAEAGATEQVLDDFLGWAREFGLARHDAVFGSDPAAVSEEIGAEQDNLLFARQHATARGDVATVAAVTAPLVTLWTVGGNYARAATPAVGTAQLFAHWTPDPDAVEAARTAAVVCLLSTLGVLGAAPPRLLHVLRALPPAPPDTPVRAAAKVLSHKDVFAPDHNALRAMADGAEPLTAAVAGLVLSYLAERDGEIEDALAAARRFLDGFGTPATPWLWLMGHERAGELTLRLELAAEARDHFAAAVRLLDVIGARRDVVGVYWGMMYACYQLDELDDADYWLRRATADDAGTPAEAEDYTAYRTSASMFELAARAEIALARGDVDTGLAFWRRAVAVGEEPGTEMQPWVLETQAGAVSAHARFGRLDPVAELVATLRVNLARLLANPLDRPPVYYAELPLAGALLLALGMVDLATGAVATGVRLVALAQRFRYLQGLQPAMSDAKVRAAAEHADGPAYADAVSAYAGLDRSELRGAALAALAARATGSGRG
jgi:predicted ATPase/DNA-binding SARP family transcriptional activator